MANIHSILQQGEAIQLGPVEVTRVFPPNAGAKYSFSLIKDASGSTALKIWGAAGNTPLQVGQKITLIGSGPKGGLKVSEYQGKISIDANNCRLEFGEGSAPAPQAAHSAPQPPSGYQAPQAPSGPTVDKLEPVMARCALATRLYIDELVVNHGFSKDEAIMLAQNAPAWYSLYWFGEKGC